MKISPIKNSYSNKNLNFGNKKVSDYIVDRDKAYPIRSANREYFEYTNFPLEEDATDLPSKRFLHSDTFRTDELVEFNEKELKRYLQYSPDDVPLRYDLEYEVVNYNNKNLFNDLTSEKSDARFKESVHSPWISPAQLKEKTEYYEFLDKSRQDIIQISGDRKTVRQIFNDCTIIKQGKAQIDKTLCRFAVRILNNSEEKTWGETEHAIIKELKIPILKNTYGAIYSKKYNVARVAYLWDKSNTEILARLKRINPIDIYGLRSIL